MSDLLRIGNNALLAYRSALDVVGHNVANANTEGYSRQRAELVSRPVIGEGVATGAGVDVSTVARVSDRFSFQRLIAGDSAKSRIASFEAVAVQLDGWLSNSDTGLSASLQSFFDGLNGLSANPSSSAARQVALQGAAALAAGFNSLQAQIDELDASIDDQMADSAAQITALAGNLAQLNERIAQARSLSPQQAPNDLLDQRDQTLRQLAQQVGVTTSTADDGSLNVFIGSGQALVLGSRAATLSLEPDAFGRRRELVLTHAAVPVTVTQQIGGGRLGGLQDARREVLDPAAGQLGRIAAALTQAVNAQHAEGMDQYGRLGGELFAPTRATLTGALGNRGGASLSARVGDASQLTGSDYLLRYDGSVWRMTDALGGASIPLDGDGSAANPLRAAGIEIITAGSPEPGDRFLLQPTHFAAGQVKLAIGDPARLAAASPVRTSVDARNSGVSQISAPEVLDAADPALLSGVTIEFTAADRYRINGGEERVYTDGGNIDFNGWRVQISGVPVAGNRYAVSANDGSSGDNGNARMLAAVGDRRLLDGGRNTVAAANAALVSRVGSQAQQAGAQLAAQTALLTQTQAQRDAASGVSLDEEAADLMRFQQAYQAAAQVVAAANTIFDALLAAVRR